VKTKVPLIVGGGLIVVFALVALVAGGGKEEKKAPSAPPPNARAVVVPAERERTVVVAPCGAPVTPTVENTAAGKATPNATTLSLPRGDGVRTLIVPNCLPKTGATNAAGNLPSAALVLTGDERPTEGQEGEVTAGSFSARQKAILPDGSTMSTVVVAPCARATKGRGRDVVMAAAKGHRDVALAPSC